MSDTKTNGSHIPESFTVRLTENARKDLSMIAAELGISVDEALSRALGMEAFLVEQDAAGTEVILKYKNGTRESLPVRARGDNAGRGRYG